MKLFNFFRKKKTNKTDTDLQIRINTSIEDTDPKVISSIQPEYSDKVPPKFKIDKELEFLSHIDGRGKDGVSNYYKSQFEDYDKIINLFFEKGYLEQNLELSLSSFTIVDLKDLLKKNSLKLTGNKVELIDRVIKNIPEKDIVSNPKYKHKYILTDSGKDRLKGYFGEKENYNDYRDEIIFQEELKKDLPHKTILIDFGDLDNSEEFKSLLLKNILLCQYHGYVYNSMIIKIISSTNERLNCPDLDLFLQNPDGRHARIVESYEDKLLLYLISKINESNILDLERKCKDFISNGINAKIKITPDIESCKCSICPTKSYTYENDEDKFPHHYGCMCLATIDIGR